MTQHNPKDTLQADLEVLAEAFEAEEPKGGSAPS